MRVYYTGDMANQPGWFGAQEYARNPGMRHLKLVEEPGGEGREFVVERRRPRATYGHATN